VVVQGESRPEASGLSRRSRHVVGLIGAGIRASLSPVLHEREAGELGLRYAYQLIDLDQLGLHASDTGALVEAARREGFTGLNITHPCKQVVVEHLDELSPQASALGAVNTVVFDGEGAIGHNTDWPGFEESFRRGLPGVMTDDVVLLGAGGAGAAVAHAALSLGTDRLTVVDAETERAQALAGALVRRFGDGRSTWADLQALPRRLAGADGLIHATPTGMAQHPGAAVPVRLLHPDLWVADLVYRPLDTELLRAARERGCRTLDGGGMAVFQAADAFELFTGLKPDRERMLRHFAALTEGSPVAREAVA
jgi:shikimate dehydrogenase